MHAKTDLFTRYRMWTIALVVSAVLLSPAGAAFFEKEYLVREVNGRDVLCDPYVVQENDYVTKLLKQRGDIADKDFPRFLRIFRALNPDVEDVDTIYPNQRILIPLKTLAPDSVAGQKSGTVTIPVITITNMPQALQQHSVEYEVQYGDWVAKLISQRFGRPGTQSYQRGLELFKKLNPDIDDIDFIRAGDTIRLPEPSIQNSAAYSAMFDESGKIVDFDKARAAAAPEKSAESATPPAPETGADVQPAPEKQVEPETAGAEKTPEAAAAEAEKTGEEDDDSAAEEDKAEEEAPVEVEVPETLKGFSDQSVFVKAATILDAELLNQGEYFFPRDGQSDLRLALKQTPLMVFTGGVRLLFANRDWLKPADQQIIESHWPGIRIVFAETGMSLQTLMETVISVIDEDGYEKRVNFEDGNIRVAVRGQFIYEPPAGDDLICLNIIEAPEMWVPAPIRAYLETNGIIVRDWIEGENISGWARAVYAETTEETEIPVMSPNPPAQVIQHLAETFGYTYQSGVEISFPYAGFQVRANTNMLSTGPGREVLIDYGDLGGDAIAAIEETGFRVVQVRNPISGRALMNHLSRLMPARFTSDPIFWSAKRPRIYNPSYQMPGVLIEQQDGGAKKVFVSFSSVPAPIASHLDRIGVELIRFRRQGDSNDLKS